MCRFSAQQIEAVIAFHGHFCPGLAIGIRAAELAQRELDNPAAHEIVAVVETDMCGVDAIQFLTGATMGKGNLIHRDHGKMAFSFFHRDTGKGFRAVLNPHARSGMDEEMAELTEKISTDQADERDRQRLGELRSNLQNKFMSLPLQEMFLLTPQTQRPPRPSRVLLSLICEHCGEKVMESRTRRFGGQTLCIPCFAEVEQKI